jgi:predicted phosphoribosyltransferase/alpha-beta hydrolase superfamily lysophospholipase
MRFKDRREAGRRLAAALEPRFRDADVVVLGLPRGGIPVAYEVARALRAPLDVIVVRKLGVPSQPELAMGAIGEDGIRIINDDVVRLTRVSPAELAAVEAAERAELERRAARFRSGRRRVPLKGKTAIIVDDGIATGSTAKAACQVARAHGATRVVVATPVAPRDCQARFAAVADEVICLHQPTDFWAVGQFYVDFSQTTDEEVRELLAAAATRAGSPREPTGGTHQARSGVDEEVTIPTGTARLRGHLRVPADATSLVIFVHGSGSSRHSPRNRYVAEVLNAAGLGTLLFDLLTPIEEAHRANVFDIELLAERLDHTTSWVLKDPAARDLPIGYFGASTGAAAALWAAAAPDSPVSAVVSRGGRPDLAIPRLEAVRAPTLLIVGGRDEVVLELNRRAQEHLLSCESRLVVVPGATHLFEEPGALERVASLARDWFTTHLAASRGAGA